MVNVLLLLVATAAALTTAQQPYAAADTIADGINPTPSPPVSSPTPPSSQTPATSSPTPAPGATPAPGTTPAPGATTAPATSSKSLKVPAACVTANLKFKRDSIYVECSEPKLDIHDADNSKRLEVVVEGSTTLTVETLDVPKIDELTIQGPFAAGNNVLPTLKLKDSLAELAISALSINQVQFADASVTLTVPDTVAYLKLDSTNAVGLSLNVSNNSSLNKVEFKSNKFTKLPACLYERKYNERINATLNPAMNGNETLSEEAIKNLTANLEDLTALNIDVDVSCNSSSSTNTDTASKYHICTDTSRTPPSGGNVGSISTPSPVAGNTDSSSSGGSSNTTLIVVIIAVSVVAVVLAAVLFQRLNARKKKASRNDDNSVNLIGKDDTLGNPKLSFISSDETLRALRLQQNEVTLSKSLGPGALWLGEHNGTKVVVKRVEAETSDAYVTKNLMSQAQVLGALSHENLVTLVGVTWIAGTDFALVAEFMDKGSLKNVLADSNWQLDLQTRLRMCMDVAQGLAYLHAPENKMHVRNFSSRKVLVNSSSECKLNLFECYPSTTKFDAIETYGAGEVAWVAPELITRSAPQDPQKINMYAFGVVLCEILARAAPFQSLAEEKGNTLSDVEIVMRIRHQQPVAPHEGRREYMRAPQSLRDAIDRCLSLSPLDRPSAVDMIAAIELAQAEISATQQLI